MAVVINLDEELARRLQAEAASRRVSVEQLATRILEKAVPPRHVDDDLSQRNQRRLDLIRKSTRCELTRDERAELDQLQSWFDEEFEDFDAGLLGQLHEMRQTVTRLSAEQSDE
ncbi:MAG: hypothetical protein ACQESR_23495 [Planctomycetota bacterium]